MNGGDDTVDRVGDKNGNTIGRSYPDRYAREIGYESIESLQFLPGHPRPVDDRDPGPVYLMPLNDGVGQHGIPPRRESLDAGTQGV